MKNKRNTYLLLAVVIAVWGMIIYKMVNTFYPDKKIAETETFHASFKPRPLKAEDTFSIVEHQRDPFLGSFESQRKKRASKRVQPLPPKEEGPKISIGFSGMIAGKSAKEHIYFVSINNKQHLMKINDEIQQVKLIRGNAKSIRIKHNNQLKTISIAQ